MNLKYISLILILFPTLCSASELSQAEAYRKMMTFFRSSSFGECAVNLHSPERSIGLTNPGLNQTASMILYGTNFSHATMEYSVQRENGRIQFENFHYSLLGPVGPTSSIMLVIDGSGVPVGAGMYKEGKTLVSCDVRLKSMELVSEDNVQIQVRYSPIAIKFNTQILGYQASPVVVNVQHSALKSRNKVQAMILNRIYYAAACNRKARTQKDIYMVDLEFLESGVFTASLMEQGFQLVDGKRIPLSKKKLIIQDLSTCQPGRATAEISVSIDGRRLEPPKDPPEPGPTPFPTLPSAQGFPFTWNK